MEPFFGSTQTPMKTMAKKTTKKRGGKRKGAGRKPDPVRKERVTMSVPIKYKAEIVDKFREITKAYVEKCKREK